jgi:hypothetical protein
MGTGLLGPQKTWKAFGLLLKSLELGRGIPALCFKKLPLVLCRDKLMVGGGGRWGYKWWSLLIFYLTFLSDMFLTLSLQVNINNMRARIMFTLVITLSPSSSQYLVHGKHLINIWEWQETESNWCHTGVDSTYEGSRCQQTTGFRKRRGWDPAASTEDPNCSDWLLVNVILTHGPKFKWQFEINQKKFL